MSADRCACSAPAVPEEAAPFALLETDPARRIVAARGNAGWLGFEPDALRGRVLDDLVSPRDTAGVTAYQFALTAYSGGWAPVLVRWNLGGVERQCLLHLLRAGDAGWRVSVLVLGERDPVHDLMLRQQQWRAVLRASTDGVAILDPGGRILEHNARFLDVMRFRSRDGVALAEESISGRPLFSLVEGPAFRPLEEALGAAQPRNRRFGGAIRYDGMLLELAALPLFDSGRAYAGCALVVRDRTDEEKLTRLHVDAARCAGKAELATGILHNIGNVLNSVGVSAGVLAEGLRALEVEPLRRVCELLKAQGDRLPEFVAAPAKRAQVLQYLEAVGGILRKQQADALAEVDRLSERVDHLRAVVASQQEHAHASGSVERCTPARLVNEARSLGDISRNDGIAFEQRVAADEEIVVDRHRVLDVLVNLLSNARHAVRDSGRKDGRISVDVSRENGRVLFRVADNGVGVAADKLERIFSFGFTTRKDGHGFGLHNASNAAREMGGELTGQSDGVGRGATFTLAIPARHREESRG